LGRNPSTAEGRGIWPAQAPDEHGQHKLQVSLASASSRRAWPAWSKAPVGHGAKLQEGMEQALGGEQAPEGYREMQGRRRREGVLTQRLGDTTVAWRGSARVATTASS
jgi:hypothetical protein